MKKQLSNEEILIKHLLEKYEKNTSNKVSINRIDLPNINLSEKDVIKSIYILEADKLLTILQRSKDDDLDVYWVVVLNSKCIHYFENKELNHKEQCRKLFNEIRAWITLAIAILGFCLSVYIATKKDAPDTNLNNNISTPQIDKFVSSGNIQ